MKKKKWKNHYSNALYSTQPSVPERLKAEMRGLTFLKHLQEYFSEDCLLFQLKMI